MNINYLLNNLPNLYSSGSRLYFSDILCSFSTIGSSCTNGQIRLMNGQTSSEGRVEYCYNREWSPLCYISGTTAALICKTLGYNSTRNI